MYRLIDRWLERRMDIVHFGAAAQKRKRMGKREREKE